MVTADSYHYLTFEMTDGTKASVLGESLTITFNGTMLIIGDKSFEISNLSKMYFSESDETMGITEARWKMEDVSEAFDLQGHKVTMEHMRKGVYIVKTKKGSFHMMTK